MDVEARLAKVEEGLQDTQRKLAVLENQVTNQLVTVDTKIQNILTNFNELKDSTLSSLNDYQSRVWGLVDKLWKVILILIGIVVLFAGIKFTGILDYLKI